MSWALIVIGAMLGGIWHTLHQLFRETRSIRRMMNDDRGIRED